VELGVNIDHIATLREARKTRYPDPIHAALIAEGAGADQITIHLREDRRHIQERDVRLLKEIVETRLNLELASSDDIVQIALEVCPHRVTIVPEKREELTTEGGLHVLRNEENLSGLCDSFHRKGIEVAFFIEPSLKQIEACCRCGVDAIEIHTGLYASAYDDHNPEWKDHLKMIRQSAADAKGKNLEVYAGHGLNIHNVLNIVRIHEIVELNIGHAIIAKAAFVGLQAAVSEMKALIQRH